MDNYPLGAFNDPRAPYNRVEEEYDSKDFVVTYQISEVVTISPEELDSYITQRELTIKEQGFSIDNVEYEEL